MGQPFGTQHPREDKEAFTVEFGDFSLAQHG